MNIASLLYYTGGGILVLLVLVIGSNFLVNVLIKQFTERALQQFQQRIAEEVAKSLEAFREGVCEQMAMQERKSDSLAKLYATLIDVLRDGKAFSAGIAKHEPLQVEKRLRTFEETSKSFCEQYRKQNLHFSNELKAVMDGFIVEQEAVSDFFERHWNSSRKEPPEKRDSSHEQIRQTWAKAEDRVLAIMDLMRSEFRRRLQPPESIMKKWLHEVAPPLTKD